MSADDELFRELAGNLRARIAARRSEAIALQARIEDDYLKGLLSRASEYFDDAESVFLRNAEATNRPSRQRAISLRGAEHVYGIADAFIRSVEDAVKAFGFDVQIRG